jgi:ABC-type multidrug transport system fused ATPase/permease subunit
LTLFEFTKQLGSMFRYHLIGVTLVTLVLGAIELTSIFSLGPVVDLFLHPDLEGATVLTKKLAAFLRGFGVPVTFWVFVGVFLVLNIVKGATQIFGKYWITRTNNLIHRRLMLQTLGDVFAADWKMLSSYKGGTLLNIFLREMATAGTSFVALADFFTQIILLAFTLAVPLYLSWKVTVISIIAGGIAAIPIFMLSRISYRLGRRSVRKANEIAALVQDSISCSKLVLGYGNRHKSVDQVSAALDVYLQAFLRALLIKTSIPLVFAPAGIFTLMVALYSAESLGIAIAETAIVMYALIRSVYYIANIASRRNSIATLIPSFEQIQDAAQMAKSMQRNGPRRPFAGLENEIVFDDVALVHDDGSRSLDGISLTIPKGSFVGLVGESGAGKTSLVDVIMGFHQPTSGLFLVDGVPLSDYDIDSYRARIAYVPQQVMFFSATIRENLLWANADATQEEIEEACRLANASDFIESLPHGYDTQMRDRALQLSRGQAQRLSLARAILRRPDVLILDEPTSSLDSHAEELIRQSVEGIARDSTVIIVAHRLSTITSCDTICVMDKGRIVEMGNHDELMRMRGHFGRLARIQSSWAVAAGEEPATPFHDYDPQPPKEWD